MSKKELEVPKFDSKDKLADFLLEVLSENSHLIKGHYLDDIQSSVNDVYDEIADADYVDSYEDSY